MTAYRVPVEDIRFGLQHLIGRERLKQLAACEALDDELMNAVIDEAARFAEQVLAPLNATGDQQGCRLDQGRVSTPDGWADAYAQFRDAGWTGLCLPEALGGQSLPKVLAMAVTEGWQGANLAFSLIQPLTEGAVEALLASGDSQLIEQYGERLVSGDWTATMALTEPAAGSDLGLMKTRAIPDGHGGYRLTGDKLYITYGEHDFTDRKLHLVLARLQDAPAGSKGISLFAVPSHIEDQNGQLQPNEVVCTGIEHKLGLHGSPTCSLKLGGNQGAWGQLVGEPNRGLAVMFVMMNEARLSVGLQGVAVGERAYQAALAWAQERKQGRHVETGKGPVALVEHPDIQRLLLGMRSRLFAARMLGLHLGHQVDCAREKTHPELQQAQQELDLLTPIFKAHVTEMANHLTGDAIQIFGGMGFIEETGAAQFYRDLRISTIYEGTTGIQAQDFLFRKIQRDHGEVFYDWLNRMKISLQPLSEHPECSSDWALLTRKIDALRNTVRDLLEHQANNATQLHAASVALLEATGILALGWQLGLSVLAAEDDGVTPKERNNVQALLAFYCAHHLPEIRVHLDRVQSADRGLLKYQFG
ncbi:MAG: acyl-CoA dehydrogenase [Saccharospirillum sp.]|uniref:acyl-CoA dehydrogenase n=1 Tax=Saccharospirillum sp. TaxID=2033801 RepID=UPI003297C36F